MTTLEQCLTEHGFIVPDYSINKIARFNASDKPKKNKSCWLKVFEDGGAIFGNWATGEEYHYQPNSERLSKSDYKKLMIEKEKQKALSELKLLDQHKAKARQAQSIIDNATIAPSNHPYLVAKGIKAYSALFGHVHSYKGALIIPVYGSEPPFINQVQSIQFIMPNGSKRFLGGAKKKGGHHVIQQVDDAPIVICEGFSTGATLAQHYTPYSTVVCAFDAGNLIHTALYYRRLYPMHQITIAGDNDRHNEINVGREKATQAANAINGMVSIPEFNDDEKGSDWNDRYRLDNGGEL